MEQTKKSESYSYIPDLLVTPLLTPLPESNYCGLFTCICELLTCLFEM